MNSSASIELWDAKESKTDSLTAAGPHIRAHNGKLFFLFLNQNIYCGYSKEPSHWDCSFEHPKHMFQLMDKKIIASLGWKILLNWPNAAAAVFTCPSWVLSLKMLTWVEKTVKRDNQKPTNLDLQLCSKKL